MQFNDYCMLQICFSLGFLNNSETGAFECRSSKSFVRYWTYTKIKISTTYVYKEYEVENKNGTEAMTTAKDKIFIGL